ncbi:glutamyl aminopeptidase isoform X3 [Oncorhynchus masou masou]|uniref:glutamyl aminopeptidase isoform X3 n=1 Tax=Oncorhynchus masou masou TaxID=90313 RepID=UPI003182EAC5
MVESMDFEKEEKRYSIHGKHVALICAVVVVSAIAVGLGVGLTRPDSTLADLAPTEETPKPTPPPADRGPCKPSNNTDGDWKNFRLPDYVKPVHYDLHLEPDLTTDLYTGSVSVHLEVSRPTRHLWLHIRETFISAVPRLVLKTPQAQREVTVAIKGCFEFKPQEYVVVEAAEELVTTKLSEVYVLSLDFQGWLNGSLVGFYRVTYTENGAIKKIAATDHEPTDARKSFPCFDEPNKKATYNISITHDKDYGALANMPMEGTPETLPGNKIKTFFQRSVPMSTYLVCFAVHQFTFVERNSSRGIPLRIYAQPAQIRTAEYAADTTKVIFDYFEEYFNMNYSIPKLDKIAIPDFGTGAMENWGLITYREANLLYDENQSSSYNKQRVASVIAHELVHQWFGNIVTMDWWDDLWLNEGFASFFEYIGVEKAEPLWGMRDIMIISDVLPVMVDDALVTSHPIIVDVSTPAEITSVFDGISYNKGASILRMVEDWLGRDSFRDGCRKYLKDFHFQNAKTANFWASLANVSGLPVADVMDTWTKQMGYPVLDLSTADTQTKLTQRRFLLDPNADTTQPPSPLSYKWTIPVKWHSVDSNKNMSIMFNKSSPEQVLADYFPATDGLLKINNDHIGFYRVNHHDSMWRTISQQLQTNHKKLFREHVQTISRQLGWDDKGSQRDRLLRETVQGIACQMGDQEVLNETSVLFDQWISGNISSVGVNLRLLVYRYGMKNSGTEAKWNLMFERYKTETLAQEKDKLLYGLASVENITLLFNLLEMSKDESIVRTQDLFTVVQYVSLNRYGKTMAWDWVTLNWDYLVNRYTINDRSLGRLLTRISTTYNTELQLWQMAHFFKLNPNAGAGEMPRQQALETVKNNIEWVRRNKAEISSWLESNVAY